MTRKDFKAAMLRGLGRCIKAVRQDPEKYRDMVLWACRGDIAYDAQCEGTRSRYVYMLASAYPDRETFINAAAAALRSYRPNAGWDLLHLSELLMCFAQDGFVSARQAVEEKYQQLLGELFKRNSRPNRIFHELSDLEQLGLALTGEPRSFLRIVGDFGRLYREKAYMEDGDFAWYFESRGSQYRKTMERAAKKDDTIACFLRREQDCVSAREKRWEQREREQKLLTGIRLSRWLAKQGDKDTVTRYALMYRQQPEPDLRAKALEAFCWCPYPDDPLDLINDTGSSCEELRNAAWRALEHIRHPAVRDFALRNAENGSCTAENFALLVTNYMPEDAKLLEKLLKGWIAEKDRDAIHAAGLDIYRAFYRGSGIPHPKHLLPLLYEHDPCSVCRGSALVYMSRHRMLTKDILEECLYDSNEDIRRMAVKRLNSKRGSLPNTKI